MHGFCVILVQNTKSNAWPTCASRQQNTLWVRCSQTSFLPPLISEAAGHPSYQAGDVMFEYDSNERAAQCMSVAYLEPASILSLLLEYEECTRACKLRPCLPFCVALGCRHVQLTPRKMRCCRCSTSLQRISVLLEAVMT